MPTNSSDNIITTIDTYYELLIPNTVHALLGKCMDISTKVNNSYVMKLKTYESGKYIAYDYLYGEDSICRNQVEILKKMLTGWTCFTDADSWDRIAVNEVFEPLGSPVEIKRNTLLFLLIPNPNIVDVKIEPNSDIINWWQYYYETKYKSNDIVNALPISDYSLLTFKYLSDIDLSPYKNYLATIKMSQNESLRGDTITVPMYQALNALVVDDIRRFNPRKLIIAYYDVTSKPNKIPHAVRLFKVKPDTSYDHICIGPELIKNPMHKKMLLDIGFSNELAESTFIYFITYQGIIKTLIRKYGLTKPFEVYIVNGTDKLLLQKVFPGCNVLPITNLITKDDIHKKTRATSR